MVESTFCGVPISLLNKQEVWDAVRSGYIPYKLRQSIADYYKKMSTEEYTNDPQDKIAKGAVKYDGGKAPIFRGAISYFPRAIEAVAAVSSFGATKYAWKGWDNVADGFNRYSDAMVRHLANEGKGEVLDPDSRFLHAAHTAWNALARLELLLRDTEDGKHSQTS